MYTMTGNTSYDGAPRARYSEILSAPPPDIFSERNVSTLWTAVLAAHSQESNQVVPEQDIQVEEEGSGIGTIKSQRRVGPIVRVVAAHGLYFVADSDGMITVFSARFAVVMRYDTEGPITAMCVDANGHLVVGGHNGVRKYEVQTMPDLTIFKVYLEMVATRAHDRMVYDVQPTRDGCFLVLYIGQLELLGADLEPLLRLDLASHHYARVLALPDAAAVLASDEAMVYVSAAELALRSPTEDAGTTASIRISGRPLVRRVTDVATTGRTVAACVDCELVIIRGHDEVRVPLGSPLYCVTGLTADTYAVGTEDGRVFVVDTAGGVRAAFTAHADAVTRIFALPDDRLCSVSEANECVVWSLD